MGRDRRVPSVCQNCGRTFPAAAYALKVGRGRFCSLSCRSKKVSVGHLVAHNRSRRQPLRYELWAGTAVLFLRRDGRTFRVLLDVADLPRVLAYSGSWQVAQSRAASSLYVRGRAYSAGRRQCFLHNFLLGARGVDHVNHDGLDNRRENLRLADSCQNAFNKRGATAASSTGVRGVYRRTGYSTYYVKFRLRGKTYRAGSFGSIEEAARVARQMLAELYREAFGGDSCYEPKV